MEELHADWTAGKRVMYDLCKGGLGWLVLGGCFVLQTRVRLSRVAEQRDGVVAALLEKAALLMESKVLTVQGERA